MKNKLKLTIFGISFIFSGICYSLYSFSKGSVKVPFVLDGVKMYGTSVFDYNYESGRDEILVNSANSYEERMDYNPIFGMDLNVDGKDVFECYLEKEEISYEEVDRYIDTFCNKDMVFLVEEVARLYPDGIDSRYVDLLFNFSDYDYDLTLIKKVVNYDDVRLFRKNDTISDNVTFMLYCLNGTCCYVMLYSLCLFYTKKYDVVRKKVREKVKRNR